jgi:hypothetical protein
MATHAKPFFKSFRPFSRPYNVIEPVECKIGKPFFEEIISPKLSGFVVSAGNVGDFSEAFFEILRDDGDFRADYFFNFLIIKLPDDPIRAPFERPFQNPVYPDRFPVKKGILQKIHGPNSFEYALIPFMRLLLYSSAKSRSRMILYMTLGAFGFQQSAVGLLNNCCFD